MLRSRPRIALALAAVTLFALLSGCAATPDASATGSTSGNASDPAAPSTSGAAPPATGADTISIRGVVVDEQIAPIAGATLTLEESDVSVTSDAGGSFAFPPQGSKLYTVIATATGYSSQTLIARPGETQLEFVLPIDRTTIAPFNTTVSFNGHFDCAAEYLFISGSCTTYFDFAGLEDPLFSNSSTFLFTTEPGWRTVVMDLAFEGQPTFDGIRITFRGKDDSDALGTYGQYGRFHGSTSYTTRVEPEQTYPDGTAGPVPANITTFQADLYPQGFLYHPGGAPVTGFGIGTNIEFQLIVTVFYVAPAPEGFTLLP